MYKHGITIHYILLQIALTINRLRIAKLKQWPTEKIGPLTIVKLSVVVSDKYFDGELIGNISFSLF